MQKIVINKCFGGFGLSDKAYARYLDIKGIEYETTQSKGLFGSSVDFWKKGHAHEDNAYLWCHDIERDDPALIQTVEELGDEANDRYAKLTIIEIPEGVEWQVEEYDGNEWIAEKHRTWR